MVRLPSAWLCLVTRQRSLISRVESSGSASEGREFRRFAARPFALRPAKRETKGSGEPIATLAFRSAFLSPIEQWVLAICKPVFLGANLVSNRNRGSLVLLIFKSKSNIFEDQIPP